MRKWIRLLPSPIIPYIYVLDRSGFMDYALKAIYLPTIKREIFEESPMMYLLNKKYIQMGDE